MRPLVQALAFGVPTALLLALLPGDLAQSAEQVQPTEALAAVMRRLRANEGAVRIGMPVASADRASRNAAEHIGTRFLPLAGSWLDRERAMTGTLAWDPDLDDQGKVGLIRVVLLTKGAAKRDMAKKLVEVGAELGLALESDEGDPDTWFDDESTGVELWISLGDDIVVVEAEILD